MERSDLRSQCCGAPVRMENGSPDFIGDTNCKINTAWYVCTKCHLPCDVKEDVIDKLKGKELSVNQRERVYVIPDHSVIITKAQNGFIEEHLEGLIGPDNQYQKVQEVFESPEFDPDDLEAFQRLVCHLKEYFGVDDATGRRLDVSIYDPNAKKGKKK